MKKIIFIIFTIFLAAAACTKSSGKDDSNNKQEDEKTIITNETIRVGIYVYDTPFLYITNDNITGFDYDIITEIAKVENLQIEFVPTQFVDLIPSLMSEQIDVIIAGMTITEERQKLMNFSSRYYTSGQGVIVNKDDESIKTIDDLIGKSVGVIKATISDTIISGIEGVNVERFDTGGSALLSLKLNKINAAMLDKISCEYYVRNDDNLKMVEAMGFSQEDYGIAVRKEDTDLLYKINHGLSEIMSNGIYDKLIEKHLK